MAYGKNQVRAYGVASETVSKTRQVIMLYDGAINFVKQARSAISEKRIEDRFNLIQRACSIILGLQSSLDFENGKEVASILNRFYETVDLRLMGIHQSNSLTECDAIIEDLKKMRDAWEEVNNTQGGDNSNSSQEDPSENKESITVSI